jgi:hypothetical protein
MGMNPPTPWPPDMATGENPPDGAVIDYFLGSKTSGVVTLEVLDSKQQLISRFKSDDPVPPLDPRYPDPTLWARPPRVLAATPGHHRFLWDMQYPQVPGMSSGPDADQAVPYNTPAVSTAPWVMPGDYTVRLTAGGKTLTQPLKVVMDPRVKASTADLEDQFKTSKAIYDDLLNATAALHEITVLREQLKAKSAEAPVAAASTALEQKLDAIAGAERGGRGGGGGGGRGAPAGAPTLGTLRTQMARIEKSIENADVAPTTAQVEAWQSLSKPMGDLLEQWKQVKATDLKGLNDTLTREKLAAVQLNTNRIDHDVEDQIELGDEQ